MHGAIVLAVAAAAIDYKKIEFLISGERKTEFCVIECSVSSISDREIIMFFISMENVFVSKSKFVATRINCDVNSFFPFKTRHFNEFLQEFSVCINNNNDIQFGVGSTICWLVCCCFSVTLPSPSLESSIALLFVHFVHYSISFNLFPHI